MSAPACGIASTAPPWPSRRNNASADTRKAPVACLRGWGIFFVFKSLGLAFDDFAGLDAAGADAHALAHAIELGLHRLQVDVPAAAGRVVGVRDVVAELRAFAAKITFLCHDVLRFPMPKSSRRASQYEPSARTPPYRGDSKRGFGSGRPERIKVTHRKIAHWSAPAWFQSAGELVCS